MNILVADDEKDIRELIKIHLLKEGYNVFTAENGQSAFELFKEKDIELAVLDVMMPKLDGYNLLNKIRKESDIPVIFLTARSEDEDKILGLGLGADDYLSKPVSMIELVARVKAQIRRTYEYLSNEEDNSETIKIGDIKVNLESCSVKLDNEYINLNAKEYKLLVFLMKNQGRVYTKEQIYEKVWGDYYYGDDNTIMVYVSRLRKKIEKDPQNPDYIKTIRGIGYKFKKVSDNV